MGRTKPVPQSVDLGRRVALQQHEIRRLQAELDNAKDVYLQLQSRVLRLELELSVLSAPAAEGAMRVVGSVAQ